MQSSEKFIACQPATWHFWRALYSFADDSENFHSFHRNRPTNVIFWDTNMPVVSTSPNGGSHYSIVKLDLGCGHSKRVCCKSWLHECCCGNLDRTWYSDSKFGFKKMKWYMGGSKHKYQRRCLRMNSVNWKIEYSPGRKENWFVTSSWTPVAQYRE